MKKWLLRTGMGLALVTTLLGKIALSHPATTSTGYPQLACTGEVYKGVSPSMGRCIQAWDTFLISTLPDAGAASSS